MTIPYVTPYWNYIVENLQRPLSHKYLLTNKVKEITFKLIHKCYPTKAFLRKHKSDIEVNCSFCHSAEEHVTHLFWQCTHTEKFWSDVLMFIQSYFISDFSFCFKDVFFGLFYYSKEYREILHN